jgi:hypothetical protein
MPDTATEDLLGFKLPVFSLNPFEISAVAKVKIMLDLATPTLEKLAG